MYHCKLDSVRESVCSNQILNVSSMYTCAYLSTDISIARQICTNSKKAKLIKAKIQEITFIHKRLNLLKYDCVNVQ